MDIERLRIFISSPGDVSEARELVDPARPGAGQTTLLAAVDRTVTAGGGRLLRHWLLAPLRDLAAIERRQSVVAWARENQSERGALQERLRLVRDLERLVAELEIERRPDLWEGKMQCPRN